MSIAFARLAAAYQPTGLGEGSAPQAANDNCYLYLASECTHGVCGSHSRSPALLALTARGDLTYDGAGLMSAAHSTSASWRYAPSDNVQDYAGTNKLDQYGSVDMGDGAGPQDQVHDAAGNLTSSGAGRTYTYNSENQLIRAEGPGLDMEYWYDSEGRRSHSLDHVANTETFHQHLGQMHPKGTSSLALGAEVGDYAVCRTALVDGACPATNTIGQGKVIAYTPLFRIILGQNIDERIAYHDVDGDDLSFYLTNHQGSTISMTTETGTQKAYADGGRYVYTPYGGDAFKGTASEVSMSGNPFRYTGRRLDAQTGLYYYRARYYDSETGRFLQTDPIGTDDQMNLYMYTGGNPINMIDPSGLDDKWYYQRGITEFSYGGLMTDEYICKQGCHGIATDPARRYASKATHDRLRNSVYGGIVLGAGGYIVATRYALQAAAVAEFGVVATTETYAGAGTVATVGGISLFRAVGPDELADIASSQAFRNLGSAEGKYFSTTLEGARQYGSMAEEAFGDPAYNYVKTTIRESLVTPQMRATVDSGIDTIVVPDKLLPKLKPEKIK